MEQLINILAIGSLGIIILLIIYGVFVVIRDAYKAHLEIEREFKLQEAKAKMDMKKSHHHVDMIDIDGERVVHRPDDEAVEAVIEGLRADIGVDEERAVVRGIEEGMDELEDAEIPDWGENNMQNNPPGEENVREEHIDQER